MKKNILLIAGSVLAFTAVSCSLEENAEPVVDSVVPMEFSADAAATRTAITDGNAVIWSEDDAISVFDGAGNREFTAGTAGSTTTKFSGEAESGKETYYALYPYSADASLAGTTIHSVLPANQYSTADGTFDTMLAPAVAKAEENGNLTFVNVAGLVKFTFTGAGDRAVKSISMTADQSLTGSYSVDMSGEEFSAVATASASAGETPAVSGITLTAKEGNLAAGPYYLVALPGTYSNVKISVVLSDGAKLNGSVGTLDINAGKIKPTTIDLTEVQPTLYDKFMAGEDIVIAGKTYNKETYGEATLIDTDYTISDADKNVYFVGQDAILNLDTSTGIRKLIIIGNDSEKRGLMNIKSQVPLNQGAGNTDGTFVIYNMDVDASTVSSNYVFAQNRDGAYGYVGIIESSLKMPSGKQFSYVSSSARSYAEIVFENSEIEIPEATEITLFSFGSSTAGYGDFIFKNNIIYSEGGVSDFKIYKGTSTSLDSFTFENNTVINLWAKTNGCVLYNSLDKISVTKNLFWTDKETTNYVFFRPTDISAAQGIPYTGNPTGTLLDDNYVYQNSNETNWQWLYGGVYRVDHSGFTEINEAEKTTVDPLSVKDFESCVFTPISEFASYGAQR